MDTEGTSRMEGREQVTIVRIAIEEMLEKTIDLWVARVYEDVCAILLEYVCMRCVCRNAHTRTYKCYESKRGKRSRVTAMVNARSRPWGLHHASKAAATLRIDIRYQRGRSRTSNVSTVLQTILRVRDE